MVPMCAAQLMCASNVTLMMLLHYSWTAVTHSGLTLAPLVGQLVAEEVMAGSQGTGGSTSSLQETAELLSPYRPTRSFPTVPTNAQPGSGWAGVLGGAKR